MYKSRMDYLVIISNAKDIKQFTITNERYEYQAMLDIQRYADNITATIQCSGGMIFRGKHKIIENEVDGKMIMYFYAYDWIEYLKGLIENTKSSIQIQTECLGNFCLQNYGMIDKTGSVSQHIAIKKQEIEADKQWLEELKKMLVLAEKDEIEIKELVK